ncbi:MAG: DUF790 family protein [Planctomycetota bacterium]|nr:DUF790 family protein [Planctomycetota bacterium]
MLTSEHAVLRFEQGRAVPDRLVRDSHAHYVQLAERMLAVYQGGAGRSRRELHRSIEGIFANEPDCPSRRIQSFIKLLDDAGEFASDPKGAAAALRLRVFQKAAPFHPLMRVSDQLFTNAEAEVKRRIAEGLGVPWPDVESRLYADVMDWQRLVRFDGYATAEALLSRYNVAQVQVALYRATVMTVWARQDFKRILRYAKLARLLLDIRRIAPDEYRLDLAGPASILRETRRYGVNMARFLPWLLSCHGWHMRAVLMTPWKREAVLEMSASDGLCGSLPDPSDYDSGVEETFARKFGVERDGWRLIREGGILWEGQTLFVPDFLFRHRDGKEVFLEIVGFWTPEYLAKKREILRLFRDRRLLLAVAKQVARASVPAGRDARATGRGVIVFGKVLKVEPVLAALGEFQQSGYVAAIPAAPAPTSRTRRTAAPPCRL